MVFVLSMVCAVMVMLCLWYCVCGCCVDGMSFVGAVCMVGPVDAVCIVCRFVGAVCMVCRFVHGVCMVGMVYAVSMVLCLWVL